MHNTAIVVRKNSAHFECYFRKSIENTRGMVKMILQGSHDAIE